MGNRQFGKRKPIKRCHNHHGGNGKTKEIIATIIFLERFSLEVADNVLSPLKCCCSIQINEGEFLIVKIEDPYYQKCPESIINAIKGFGGIDRSTLEMS